MLAAVQDGVGLITFNQPEKRNAMSVEMWDGLTAILDAWERTPAVRVVVLTGAGDKAFVSGADISQFAKSRSNADAQKEYDKLTSAGRAQARGVRQAGDRAHPGVLPGRRAGDRDAGRPADRRREQQFGIPAAKLGIAYGFDMVRRLISLVGQAHARTLLFTGERIDAAEAERIGLVNQVVPDGGAGRDGGQAGAQDRGQRAAVDQGHEVHLAQALRDPAERDMAAVLAAVAACFDSADYTEGRTAFMEKRKPVFQGAGGGRVGYFSTNAFSMTYLPGGLALPSGSRAFQQRDHVGQEGRAAAEHDAVVARGERSQAKVVGEFAGSEQVGDAALVAERLTGDGRVVAELGARPARRCIRCPAGCDELFAVASSATWRQPWTRTMCSNRSYTSGSRTMLAKGARPVPVPRRYRLRPGVRLSCTRVPTGLRPTRSVSPGLRCCRREVSGPWGP